MAATSIGLAELLYQVKRDLLQPEDVFADPVPLLSVEEVELELAVTVSKRAGAGLNIQVVELAGGGERADVHRVLVRLAPLLTREERLAQLQKDPRWNRVVEIQIAATLKGVEGQSHRDPY
jgi:hypothetical protein